jgi:DNA-directed RNA polymerase specialized sigma24 family protein
MRLSRGASIDELERVYRSAFLRFVRVATAISGNEESGADAVHDAFVQAVRSRRSYRGEGPLEA